MRTKVLYTLAFIFAVVQAAGNAPITLTGTIRDFSPKTNSDFEYVVETEPGIVELQLGADKKPVYNGAGGLTTHGAATFKQWFNDVDGINLSQQYSIKLTDDKGDGIYTYENSEFFPIDDQLLGNEDKDHNFHFTFEVHTVFTYQPGQVFSFAGDDDLWVFINNQLVLDLGGVHSDLSDDVRLDTLGLDVGANYNLDIFFAERHTTQSSFKIQTSIQLTSAEHSAMYPPRQAVFRWYNPTSNDHFYTTDSQGETAPTLGYTLETTGFYTLYTPDSNVNTIYRLSGLGQHVYTIDSDERDSLVKSGKYVDEGVFGYVYAIQQPNTVALSRYVSSADNSYYYSNDGDTVPAGYTLQGVLGYAFTN